jgi:hypothetical protein
MGARAAGQPEQPGHHLAIARQAEGRAGFAIDHAPVGGQRRQGVQPVEGVQRPAVL